MDIVWKRPPVGGVSEWCDGKSADDVLEEWEALSRDYRDAQEKRREMRAWLRKALGETLEGA